MEILALYKKYYTLFNMEVKNIPNSRGYAEDRKCYSKIKKVSMNKEKAIKLCPDAMFDEELVVRYPNFSIPMYETRTWNANDRFRFGKYFGERIDECNDYDYMVWYFDHIENENGKHNDFVKKCLINAGYIYKDMGGYGYFLSPVEVKRSKLTTDKNAALIEKLENGLPISFGAERNVFGDGNYKIKNVTYHFNNLKSNYYNGFFCYMPMNAKGIGKRIKFKNVIVTKYTYEINGDEITIFIDDFNVINPDK